MARRVIQVTTQNLWRRAGTSWDGTTWPVTNNV